MTIRHLKIFTTVADTGGMSAAAKKLHVSQPTVSQAISELEKHYGVKLFESLRTAHRRVCLRSGICTDAPVPPVPGCSEGVQVGTAGG